MQDCSQIEKQQYNQMTPIIRNSRQVIGVICPPRASGSLANNGNIDFMEQSGLPFTIIYQDGIERVNWLPRMC